MWLFTGIIILSIAIVFGERHPERNYASSTTSPPPPPKLVDESVVLWYEEFGNHHYFEDSELDSFYRKDLAAHNIKHKSRHRLWKEEYVVEDEGFLIEYDSKQSYDKSIFARRGIGKRMSLEEKKFLTKNRAADKNYLIKKEAKRRIDKRFYDYKEEHGIK